MANLHVSVAGGENDNLARVTPAGALTTAISPTIAIEDRITSVPFTQFLTVNGDGTTSALNVNGATTPIAAYVTGNQLGDFYITTANVLISDSGAVQPNRFGADSPLANGVDVVYQFAGADVVLANFKTNFDVLRFSPLTAATGTKGDAFLVSNATIDNQDAYNPRVDLARLSPYGFGVRIKQNTKDKFGIIIRDDLTGLGTFNIQVSGFIRLINDQGE